MEQKNLPIFSEQKNKFSLFVEIISNILFAFVLTVSFAIITFSATYISTQVEGASMMPTLNLLGDHKQDKVFVNRFSKPEKQDIVVVKEIGKSYEYIIKRLIATEGDEVNVVKVYNTETNLNDYFLTINGSILQESYIYQHNDIGLEIGENNYNGMYSVYKNLNTFKENNQQFVNDSSLPLSEQVLIVPENHVFILGDNRGNSADSSSAGFYSNGQVLGRVDHIVRHGQSTLKYFLNIYTPFSF